MFSPMEPWELSHIWGFDSKSSSRCLVAVGPRAEWGGEGGVWGRCFCWPVWPFEGIRRHALSGRAQPLGVCLGGWTMDETSAPTCHLPWCFCSVTHCTPMHGGLGYSIQDNFASSYLQARDIWLCLEMLWWLELNQGVWVLLSSSGQRPEMPLNTLQHTGQPTWKNYPAPNVNCAKAEKPWCKGNLPGSWSVKRRDARVETKGEPGNSAPRYFAAVAFVPVCILRPHLSTT